jgi:hypothetical protein
VGRLSPERRREIRNHGDTCYDESRRCLAMRTNGLVLAAPRGWGRAAKLQFRLLATVLVPATDQLRASGVSRTDSLKQYGVPMKLKELFLTAGKRTDVDSGRRIDPHALKR